MHTLYWIAGGIVVLVGGFYAFNSYIYNEKQGDPSNREPLASSTDSTMNTKTLPEIIPIEHASGIIQWGETAIYTDPVGAPSLFAAKPTPGLILLSDIHGDHLSTDAIASLGTTSPILAPQEVFDKLTPALAARTQVLANGESAQVHGFTITAIPMYNIPGSASEKYHTKGRGNGYLIEKDGVRVYLAGDTAGTPEMRALTNIDIALVPMNLPYTMSVDEAADAVLAFKPHHVYPYHYRGPDGLADVEKFKALVHAGDPSIDVVLLAGWYPQK